jgi:hypothetical protein
MDKQLFIPDKIRVGFQNREDTFTKKLAYVIYYDLKGVLRKEKSWQTWRDKKIDPVEFDNVPTEGFVLNKKVGGYRGHFNFRDAHVRVYDPRDFEFEISVPNLLFILRECDCYRGKGLEGKFVYAWDGTELVLLPERSEDYQNSKKYTVLQGQKVKVKELVPGASYITKKQVLLTYLGKFDYYSVVNGGRSYSWKSDPAVCKRYVFWNGKTFVPLDGVGTIAAPAQADSPPDLAELIQQFHRSPHGTKVVGLVTKDIPRERRTRKKDYQDRGTWVFEESPGIYIECIGRYDGEGNVTHVEQRRKVYLKDGAAYADYHYKSAYRNGGGYYNSPHGNPANWVDPTGKELWGVMESGAEYRFHQGELVDPKEPTYGEDDD